MNFLRCNKCYDPLKTTNPPFSLTQCGHLFCNKCVSNDKNCWECKATGVEVLPLTKPLPDRVASLFVPAQDLLDQFLFTYKFQYSEMMITMRRFEEIEKKYNGMKMAYWKLRKHTDELTKAYKKLQEAQLRCQATHKVTPSQAFVNMPRSYFEMANSQSSSQRNNNNHPNHMLRGLPNNRLPGLRFNVVNSLPRDGYQTDESMASIKNSRLKNNIETPPMTPDGIFRIPAVRNITRSSEISSITSRDSSNYKNITPLAHKQIF